MDTGDKTPAETQPKRSLMSKIAWGTLVVGAGVAIAAIVGFVFFPVATKNVIDGIASLFGESGKTFVDNVLGRFDVSSVNEAAKTITPAANEVARTQAGLITEETGRGWLGWVNNEAYNTASSAASGAQAALKTAEATLDRTTRAAIAGSTGLIKFIMDHKIIASAAAALSAYGLANASSKNDLPPPRPEAAESFAIKEDMRKMQHLMMLRAAYAGNPQAQAMLQQQQGLA